MNAYSLFFWNLPFRLLRLDLPLLSDEEEDEDEEEEEELEDELPEEEDECRLKDNFLSEYLLWLRPRLRSLLSLECLFREVLRRLLRRRWDLLLRGGRRSRLLRLLLLRLVELEPRRFFLSRLRSDSSLSRWSLGFSPLCFTDSPPFWGGGSMGSFLSSCLRASGASPELVRLDLQLLLGSWWPSDFFDGSS